MARRAVWVSGLVKAKGRRVLAVAAAETDVPEYGYVSVHELGDQSSDFNGFDERHSRSHGGGRRDGLW